MHKIEMFPSSKKNKAFPNNEQAGSQTKEFTPGDPHLPRDGLMHAGASF